MRIFRPGAGLASKRMFLRWRSTTSGHNLLYEVGDQVIDPRQVILPKKHYVKNGRYRSPKKKRMMPTDVIRTGLIADAIRAERFDEDSYEEQQAQLRFLLDYGVDVDTPMPIPFVFPSPLELRFPGGGAKGALLLPALQVLMEDYGHSPISYTGSSVGSIPAYLLAMGMTPEELALAMDMFENVLNMPIYDEGMRRMLGIDELGHDKVLDEGLEGLGAGLGASVALAGLTGKAIAKQGFKLSDQRKLRRLLEDVTEEHVVSKGLTGFFKNPRGPKFSELLEAFITEPNAGFGMFSLPMYDPKNRRTIRGSAETMPEENIIHAIMGATAHPVLFRPVELSDGTVVIDGGVGQNIGFPGYFQSQYSMSGNFIGDGEVPTTWSVLQMSQLLEGYTSSQYAAQSAMDEAAWGRGMFGSKMSIPFDPKLVSTTQEMDPKDRERLFGRVRMSALDELGPDLIAPNNYSLQQILFLKYLLAKEHFDRE